MLGMRSTPGTAPLNATRPMPPPRLQVDTLDRTEMLRVLDQAKAHARRRSRKGVKKSKSISSYENPLAMLRRKA